MTNYKKKLTDDEMWMLISDHKSHLTSTTYWNQYAKLNALPHSQTLIKRLGKWNEIKSRLNLKVNQQSRPPIYHKNDLEIILKEHRSHFNSIQNWNQFASKHKLPTFGVFERQYGEDHMKRFIRAVVSENLATLIRREFPEHPPTYKEWEERARERTLPSAMYIVRNYGKWSNMKYQVYNI